MRGLVVLFYKIRFLDKSIKRQIYIALCNSILLYGTSCPTRRARAKFTSGDIHWQYYNLNDNDNIINKKYFELCE